jgi:[acyl-carrier-protein] S-malonyltransferase
VVVLSKIAYVFPGQGSQSVGMGKDLFAAFPVAQAVFQEADQVLRIGLSRLCFEGPEEDLRATINAQPALLTVSYACLQAGRELGVLPPPAYLAGHSLGEYTALLAAGSMDFATAVRLARERGRLMYEAGQAAPGTMAAVIGIEESPLASVCAECGAVIANINCPGQIAISGATDRVAQACALAKTRGAARAIPLPVSGAFHSPLMGAAQNGMARVLSAISFKDPSVPVIANTTAQALTRAGEICPELLTQLGHCVQWQRSIEYMLGQGVTTFVEIGPGKVLTGLIKRINRAVQTLNLADAAALKELLGRGGDL